MKKLLTMFVFCLLAIPAMAFYPVGEPIALKLSDGLHKLVCDKPENMSSQECSNKGDKIRLLIFLPDGEEETTPEQEAYSNEEIDLVMRGVAKDKKLIIQNTRDCKEGNAAYVVYLKAEWIEGDMAGMVVEYLSKAVPGKGSVKLQRYYEPEPDENMNVMKLITNEDLAHFCKMEFPEK